MMHEILSRAAELHVPAASHEHWRSRDLHDAGRGNQLHRVGPSFSGVGIRQSATPHVQAKLTVSHPGDSAEREADRVAEAVMQTASQPAIDRQEDPAVQRACAACAKPEAEERKPESGVDRKANDEEEVKRSVDRKALDRKANDEDEVKRSVDRKALDRKANDEDEVKRSVDRKALDREANEDDEVKRSPDGTAEKDDEKLQAKSRSDSVPQVTPELDTQIHSVHGGGAPLARETRAFFEPRMGADLSNVRVSTGPQASRVARQLNARAFTVGNNITFGAGQYQPSSNDGKQLIAHELTHVIQQGGARGARGKANEG
jgi:Domain of unknown function (DUF4157)